ncbi:MAG: hypothetical protein KAI72_03970, partial [Candidatus Pacebacteria bacterium]|nr:hypothetical protein [Candidatus Paceibacterota bacterium]
AGDATSILAPATAGEYKLFVIDAAGNCSSASAATLTVDNTGYVIWVASAAGNWSTAANWSTSVVPAAGDDVVFNGASTANCAADTVNNNLGSIKLDTGYTGTVTFSKNAVSSGMSLTLTGDITVNDGNLVFEGDTAVDSYPATPEIDGTGYTINAANITIASGASMNVDGMGFAAGAGPGVGGWNISATYGGLGGGNNKSTYGLVTNPTSLGSGGYGAGGGAIILNVTTTLTVDGTLSANGISHDNGSGSGGSINITAGTLLGSGTIEAKGGVHLDANTFGAGGGRISLVNVSSFSYSGKILAGSSDAYDGHPGTIAFPANFDLVVGGAGNSTEIILGTDSTPYAYAFNSITINDGGILRVGGNPLLNVVDGVAQGTSATISVTTNITINTGGILTADQLGFERFAKPPGGGQWDIGGTYGGVGHNNTKPSYGSVTNPISLGSNGYRYASGGGALILDVTGTLTVDGTLSANGGEESNSSASGGSVNITTDTISGSGTIEAKGGTALFYAGGGGRIKIEYSTKGGTNPIDSDKVYAYGGSGNGKGSAGTIVLKDPATQTYGDLIVDDNSYGVLDIPIPSSNFTGTPATLTFDSVTVKSKAKLKIPGNCKLASVGDIDIGTSADNTDTARIIAAGKAPIAHWKMNDNAASTTVADAMGNHDAGAQQNTSVLTATGKVESALTFNGTTDYIETAADIGVSGAGQRTISLWAQATAAP